MKVSLIVLILLSLGREMIAQKSDDAALVHAVVHDGAMVKQGESIYVFGGAHALPLIENIKAACTALGAKASAVLDNSGTDAPFKNGFLRRSNEYQILNNADVWIVIRPLVKNPDSLYRNISDRELLSLAKTEHEICAKAIQHDIRILHVLYPSAEMAANMKIDYQRMVLKACIYNEDEVRFLPQYATRLKTLLSRAGNVRIRTKAGTNFSCLVNNRPIVVNDGKITEEEMRSSSAFDKQAKLPGWTVEVSVLETSGNGKVIVPIATCDGSIMKDVSFNFVKGKVENFTAGEGGECFKNKLGEREGPKDAIGSLLFGFNPELKVVSNDSVFFCPKGAGGVIWVTIGGNEHLGGKNPVSCGEFSFPMFEAVVETDGKPILGEKF